MSRRDHRDDETGKRDRELPASPEGALEDASSPFAGATPDMSRDPLAGAMGQDSLQGDTMEEAVEEDTGLPARNDPAPSGGPGSRNTSAPAGEEIGEDEPMDGP